MTPRSLQKHRSGVKKPYQPAVGVEFDVEEVSAIEARTRGFLARFLAVSAAVVVAITGGYGLVTGNYMPLEVVWAVAGPIVGALVAYYFGRPRNTTG